MGYFCRHESLLELYKTMINPPIKRFRLKIPTVKYISYPFYVDGLVGEYVFVRRYNWYEFDQIIKIGTIRQ